MMILDSVRNRTNIYDTRHNNIGIGTAISTHK